MSLAFENPKKVKILDKHDAKVLVDFLDAQIEIIAKEEKIKTKSDCIQYLVGLQMLLGDFLENSPISYQDTKEKLMEDMHGRQNDRRDA